MIEANYDLKIIDLLKQIDNKKLSKSLKIKSLEEFYDICVFNSITSLDLDVVIDGYLNSKFDWQKRFYVRSMILILNEHLEKVHKLMKSKFYMFIDSNNMFSHLEEEILENRKSYKEINKRKSILSGLRNDVIGHRNENSEEFFNSINDLKCDEIFNLVLDTQKILNEFVNLSTKILKEITNNFQEFYSNIK
ncbi:hypothetical protein [Flavobacterium sp. N2820]|uniref:hypothetical protein n=1 Tax=Flavobacterium sp. N2820 TaxID=2986834 RepID=UPI002225331A|nr:hypothetical protein [Flavobacterium sp. N2820]